MTNILDIDVMILVVAIVSLVLYVFIHVYHTLAHVPKMKMKYKIKKIILHVLVFFICIVKSFVEITLPIPNDLNLSLIRLG